MHDGVDLGADRLVDLGDHAIHRRGLDTLTLVRGFQDFGDEGGDPALCLGVSLVMRRDLGFRQHLIEQGLLFGFRRGWGYRLA